MLPSASRRARWLVGSRVANKSTKAASRSCDYDDGDDEREQNTSKCEARISYIGTMKKIVVEEEKVGVSMRALTPSQ